MKKLLGVIFFTLLSSVVYASSLYYPYQLLELDYNFLDTKNYDAMKLRLEGSTSIYSGNLTYKFQNLKPAQSNSLTQVALGYSHIAGNNWFGASISSASDKLFDRADLVDFDIFYAYRILDSELGTIEYPDGSRKASYYRLYFGITYNTMLSFADNYPMPVLRYEYESHAVSLILGYPVNYFRMRFSSVHSFEIKYVPIADLLVSYNMSFNSYNTFSIQFQIENDRYRISNVGARTYLNRTKYFEEYYWVRFKYSLNVKNVVKVAPYVQLLVDGKQYLANNFFGTRTGNRYTGFGYSLGTTIDISF